MVSLVCAAAQTPGAGAGLLLGRHRLMMLAGHVLQSGGPCTHVSMLVLWQVCLCGGNSVGALAGIAATHHSAAPLECHCCCKACRGYAVRCAAVVPFLVLTLPPRSPPPFSVNRSRRWRWSRRSRSWRRRWSRRRPPHRPASPPPRARHEATARTWAVGLGTSTWWVAGVVQL